MKKILLLLILLLSLGTSVAFANVEATGVGANKGQALTAALRRAVEQSVGIYLQSSSASVNSVLVEDKIFSHSKGYVNKYSIIKEGKIEDGYSVTISAKVDDKILKDDINALTILRKVSGDPRILVVYSSKNSEGPAVFKNKGFVDEIYNGIVESLTDKQFRVVDKADAQKFARQIAEAHEVEVDSNSAAKYGLKYKAEYTLLYSVSGTVKEGAVNNHVLIRLKTQLIDNTRSQVITSKMVEQSASASTVEQAMEKSARDGGKKIVSPMLEIIQKNWMDMQQNGSLYTVVMDGVEDAEAISNFTGMFEKFPLVNSAKEVESGGGKTTFEATYRGKRDELDRDVLRAAKELGWTVKKIRAEGARSSWKKL